MSELCCEGAVRMRERVWTQRLVLAVVQHTSLAIGPRTARTFESHVVSNVLDFCKIIKVLCLKCIALSTDINADARYFMRRCGQHIEEAVSRRCRDP